MADDTEQDAPAQAPPAPPAGGALAFPLRGLAIQAPYTAQPPGTTPDCLNVLPFDPRANRARGGQRAGTGKVNVAALGSGGPVNRMHQSVQPASPATFGRTLWYDDFASATAGMEIGDFGSLGRGNYYTASENGAFGYGTYIGVSNNNPGCLILSTNRLWRNGGHVASNITREACALRAPAYPFPRDNFEVTANVFLNSGYDSPLFDIWIYGKAQHAVASNGDGIALVIDRKRIMLDNFPGSHAGVNGYPETYTFPALLPSNVQFEITLRFQGNIVTGLVNGVVRVQSQYDNTALLNNDTVGFGTGGFVQAQDAGVADFRVRELPIPAKPRKNIVAACCDGSIYVGQTPAAVALVSGGDSALFRGNPVSSADVNGLIVFVDGVNTKYYDSGDGTVKTLTAGQYPDSSLKGQVPQACQLACVYRGRLVLARQSDNPQNIYMSRSLDPFDWDYAQEDPLASVALNASASAGRIGQPVNCVFPTLDDQMVIGCDQSMFMMQGDPADGGNIVTLSDQTGIIGKDAYCIDPQGDVYFVGHGGLFKIPVAGYHNPYVGHKVENLSKGRLDPFFASIDKLNDYVVLAFDRDRQGVWIFVTKPAGASKHLYYDLQTDGFFYQQFPDNHGPLAALTYDGNDSDNRYLMLGGRDGFIRRYHATHTSDDGAAISSYVYIGPFRGGDDVSQMKLDAADFYLGEIPAGFTTANWHLRWLMQAGKDAYTSLTSPRNVVGGTFITPGRQLVRRQRLQAGAFTLKLFNDALDTFWTFERVQPTIVPAGRQR